MPYTSKSQARFFHAAAEKGEIDPAVVAEFDKATKGKFKKLPERAKAKAKPQPRRKVGKKKMTAKKR